MGRIQVSTLNVNPEDAANMRKAMGYPANDATAQAIEQRKKLAQKLSDVRSGNGGLMRKGS